MIITKRKQVAEVIERIQAQRVCLPIFGTGSHWNTEAVLIAARNISEKYGVRNVPVAIGMTFNYEHMPQAQRITSDKNPRTGFLSMMSHMSILADDKKASYYDVHVLPHLDHAHPERDAWPLTKGVKYLASVMFDAQTYPLDENMKLTKEYARAYRDKVFIEGIMDELTVAETHVKETADTGDDYPERAYAYVRKTGVDFLVADLGTEQQASNVGGSVYLQERARGIRDLVGKKILVLHGTSCLSNAQIGSLPDDGILRVNMWTRIARDAGLHAYHCLRDREAEINKHDFNAIESCRYLRDSTQKAAEIMEEIMVLSGYANLN
jgi:fructose/tagatose bisphosphate aldolase